MGQSDALQRAAERLDMAVEELEAFLRQAFAQWPTVMFNYRFIVVVKKLILS